MTERPSDPASVDGWPADESISASAWEAAGELVGKVLDRDEELAECDDVWFCPDCYRSHRSEEPCPTRT